MLLLSELAHVLHGADVNAVLLDDLALVQHVELLRGVLAREEHDGLLAARVVLEEVGHVVDLVAHDDPAVGLGRVLRDVGLGAGHLDGGGASPTLAAGVRGLLRATWPER